MKKFLTLITLLILSSCATREEMMQKNLGKVWEKYFEKKFDETRPVEILVATNRQPKTESFTCDDTQFGVNVSKDLRFGVCKINVPKTHLIGDLGGLRLLGATAFTPENFFAELKKSQRSPLIFVHGFNVRYQEAVTRAAQIAYDLKYQGPVILFTWPAGSGEGFIEEKMLNKTYAANASNAHDSITTFKNFLISLQKNEIKPNLFVHSMGHQIVLPALKSLAEPSPQKTFINQLILNAPDFDLTQFRGFTSNLNKIANRTTLYCSENDKAMIASKNLNNNERLGSCAYVKEIDVVNVSAIDDPTLGLGHGYYSSRAILGDVFQALIGINANNRLFIAKSDPHGPDKYFLRK
ncbi:MAG: alpha/beta hydrolase [Alphaproteobacteria bacterium]|nr:alpha/beta hydrolase [Alphaproteobacteria bacterium]